MNNSITRLIVINILSLCCLISTACAKDLSIKKTECLQDVLNSEIVRIDNKNQRLFVINKNMTPEFLGSKLKNIKLCLKDSEWDDDWAISIFSEEKYAGYKDEQNIIPLHKNNEWAKAYKLEYLNSNGIIILTPALDPKEIKP